MSESVSSRNVGAVSEADAARLISDRAGSADYSAHVEDVDLS
jgi:hypothetical protein